MTRLSSWIISLGVHIYRCLLAVGPADFRREYEEQVVHTFQESCKDAYLSRGLHGVIGIWPSLFSEAILDMLAERFNTPVSSQESYRRIFYSTRQSMITIFFAFVLFATAYVCLHSIATSQASLSTLVTVREFELIFTIIKYSTNIAFLAIVLCGLPVLFFVSKRAIAPSRSHRILLFFITAGQVLALLPMFIRIIVSSLGYSIVVTIPTGRMEGFMQFSLESVLSFVFLADIALLIVLALYIGATSPAFVIPQQDFSMLLLRLARMPMIITTIAMTVAFVATMLWAIKVFIVVPALPSNGISPRILVLLVFASMAISCGFSFHTMRGNTDFYTPPTT